MLLKVSALKNWRVEARDGDIGGIADVLFDDEGWSARYLVVDTGSWLSSRRVLLAPAAVHRVAGDVGRLHVDLTRAEVESGPDLDTDRLVPLEQLQAHAAHYGYPVDWAGPMVWVPGPSPGTVAAATPVDEGGGASDDDEAAQRTHLHSAIELIGAKVEAADGDAGELDDLGIDDEDWRLRRLIVDVRRWWPGGRVAVDPAQVTALRWDEPRLRLALTREQLRQAPPSD